jgi:hypothetical protein
MGSNDERLTRQQRWATMLFGGLLVVFGAVWAFAASQIPIRSMFQPIPPSFLPFWAGLALMATGVLLTVSYALRRAEPDDPAEPLFDRAGQLRVALFLLVLLAYTIFLESVHYLWLTFLVTVAALLVAREKFGWPLLFKALASSGVFYLVFIRWFAVSLPGSRFF